MTPEKEKAIESVLVDLILDLNTRRLLSSEKTDELLTTLQYADLEVDNEPASR